MNDRRHCLTNSPDKFCLPVGLRDACRRDAVSRRARSRRVWGGLFWPWSYPLHPFTVLGRPGHLHEAASPGSARAWVPGCASDTERGQETSGGFEQPCQGKQRKCSQKGSRKPQVCLEEPLKTFELVLAENYLQSSLSFIVSVLNITKRVRPSSSVHALGNNQLVNGSHLLYII